MKAKPDWQRLAKRLARAIVRYDNCPFAGGMSERAILLARKLVRKTYRG